MNKPLLIGLSLSFLVAAACGAFAQTPAPELTRKIAPQYPIRAMDRGLEGWVEINFQIGADGTVSNAKVTASMPEDTFDKAALAAVSKWQYAPAETGRPLPRTEVIAFSMLTTGTIRSEVVDQLNMASKAIQDGRAGDAEKIMKKVADADQLTLTELMFLERVRGLADYKAGRFSEASRHFNRMLEVFATRMAPEAVVGVVQMLAMAQVSAGAFPEAIAAVDRWLPPDRSLEPSVSAMLGRIRQALTDGRPIRLAPTP